MYCMSRTYCTYIRFITYGTVEFASQQPLTGKTWSIIKEIVVKCLARKRYYHYLQVAVGIALIVTVWRWLHTYENTIICSGSQRNLLLLFLVGKEKL